MSNINTAILFLCHKVNNGMLERYWKLVNETNGKYDIYWVFQSDNGISDDFLINNDVNVYRFSLASLNELYYIPLSEKLYGSEHFIMERFVHDHQEYTYYWVIEYDVIYKGNWFCFFSAFDNCDADFLSSHIEFRHESEKWPWWHLARISQKCNISSDDFIKSFNPIYRISFKAADYLDSFLQKDNYGFYEIIMSTALFYGGFKLCDIGGRGSFVPEGCEDAHYVDSPGINNGTMRFRPEFSIKEIMNSNLKNKLFHPLK